MTTSRGAELSSLSTVLEDLNRRLLAMADGYAGERREDVATELYAIERLVANAARRLGRVVDADRGPDAPSGA
jgi:hypothetical protein